MSEKIKLSGLWSNQTQSGDSYLSGSLGSAKLLIFKNTFKEEGSNQPDYNLYLAPIEKKEEAAEELPPTKPQDNIPF